MAFHPSPAAYYSVVTDPCSLFTGKITPPYPQQPLGNWETVNAELYKSMRYGT
jgi:hypothetical protein